MSATSIASSNQELEKDALEPKKDQTSTPPPQTDTEKQTPQESQQEPQYVSGIKLWLMTAGVTLVLFVMLLDISIVSTATPKITSDFHSLDNVGWYGAAYQLTSATLQPLTGKVYTNFNLKWTFFIFFLVFELGSLLCGVAVSSNMLIIGRAVAGIGSSGLLNGAVTIISNATPMHKRAAYLGIVMGFGQLGLVTGPLVGGVLTQYATWRWCFYINLPIGGLIAALLAFISIPEPAPKPPPMTVLPVLHKKLDLIGFVLFAPASIMLLLAVQWGGNEYAWNSATVIGLICGAAATLIVWLIWNYHKKDEAMVPVSMLKKRHVWTSCLMGGAMQAALFINSYFLPIYFQGVRGKSPAISGVYLLPSILSQLVGAVVVGKLIGIFGYYLPFGAGASALAAIGYGLLSTLAPHTSTGEWIGYQIIAGTGRGLGMSVPLLAVQNNLAPVNIPVAMAIMMAIQTYCGALFLSFGATIFTNSLRSLVSESVPGVNADAVAHAGAYAFRKVVPAKDLPAVLKAYAHSVDHVFYLTIGLAGVAFVFSWGMGWADIRKKKGGEKKAEPPAEQG